MSRFVFLALLLASPAVAAQSRLKVAVLDVRTNGAVKPESVAGLADLVASDASQRGLDVVSKADLVALLGFEQQKLLMGCDDGSCLAELGGALGVDFVLSVQVSEVGGVLLLSMSLLDATAAKALRRLTKRPESAKGLVDAAMQANAEVFEASFLEQQRRLRRGLPASSGPPAGAWVVLGTGVAALVAGGIVAALGVSNFQEAQRIAGTGDARFASLKAAAAWQLPLGDVLVAAGLVGAAAGGIWLWTSAGSGGDATTVGVAGRF